MNATQLAASPPAAAEQAATARQETPEPMKASRTAQETRAGRLASADSNQSLTQMQIEIVQSAAQMIRGLACNIVGAAFTRLPPYLPRAQEKHVSSTLERVKKLPKEKLDQVALAIEPVMGQVISGLANDLRDIYHGLIEEAIRERIPDDSTRCYVLLAIRVREAELALTAAFPDEAKQLLENANADATEARKLGGEAGEAKAERILAAADHKVSALGAAPLAAAKQTLNTATDAAKAVEPFYYRTQLCLKPHQAAMVYSAQERAAAEKNTSVGMQIMCAAYSEHDRILYRPVLRSCSPCWFGMHSCNDV